MTLIRAEMKTKFECVLCGQTIYDTTLQACALPGCDPKADLYCDSNCGHESCDERAQACIYEHQDTHQ